MGYGLMFRRLINRTDINQTTIEVGLHSRAWCVNVIVFGFKVAHLKENTVILLENKTKVL